MTTEQAVFTLVTGLSGRLYLSGFLYRLDEEARALVAEAVGLHKTLRQGLPDSLPFWPLGLPGWTDEVICLGLHTPDGDLVFVWDRAEATSTIVLPGVVGDATIIFPSASAGWTLEPAPAGLTLTTTPGHTARVISIGKDQS